MEARQITPVHFYSDYGNYYEAIEQAKGDIVPNQFAWQFVKEQVQTFEAFCQFLNDGNIENWVFDDGADQLSIRLRFSQFKRASIGAGLAHNDSFRLR